MMRPRRTGKTPSSLMKFENHESHVADASKATKLTFGKQPSQHRIVRRIRKLVAPILDRPVLWPARRQRRNIVLGILVFLLIVWIFPLLKTRRVDHMLTYHVMATVFELQQAQLKDLGVDLPTTKIEYANAIHTHAALRELLIRRERRAEHLQRLEANADCVSNASDPCNSGLPRFLFVPNIAGWSPMRPPDLHRYNLTSISFDEIEMKHLVDQAVTSLNKIFGNENASTLHTLYFQFSPMDRVYIWALSVLFLYGGLFMGNISRWQTNVGSHLFSIFEKFEASSSLAFYAYSFDTSEQTKFSPEIELLAATAGNPILACLLQKIAFDGSAVLAESHVMDIMNTVALKNASMHEHDWLSILMSSVFHEKSIECPQCFKSNTFADCVSVVPKLGYSEYNLFVRSFERIGKLVAPMSAHIQPRHDKKVNWTRTAKTRLETLLRQQGGEPGWLCNRCLNWAEMGTFEKCASVCPKKYKETICLPRQDREVVDYEVVVMPNMTEIPKIVHQTWFDDITADRFPQLSRLQASWRSSGWDYRFYTDDDARDYIERWYPKPFLESFDALVHGAYKADLFRYLVLLREGGVYADVDVMLETDLDNFIVAGMSFFAPRDVPCEYAGEAFCLWNGILGSTPGNPILVRAVERLVNLIQDRADTYDMEREVCLHEGANLPMWKIRAQPLLFLSGPCGIGLAMNEALDRSSLERLPIGYVGATNRNGSIDFGDAFVLVGDKYDLGQFRISDSDRNIILASTDIPGASSAARTPLHATKADQYWQSTLRKHRSEHYSLSKKGVKVWGASNVYINDLASDIAIRMHIKYTSP